MRVNRRDLAGQSPVAGWWRSQCRLLADRTGRRLVQLYAGLILYGISLASMVHARIGLDPWDVLHQGVARHTHIRFGTVTILVGVVVLALWVPLRQAPGFGTVNNALVIGLVTNMAMPVIPDAHTLPMRLAMLAGSVLANGVATGCYIGAGLGPGPRDGLMTGLAARGHSVRVVRTAIEVTVLATGWMLGGSVGVGTVVFALTIGPLAHVLIPAFAIGQPRPSAPRVATDPALEALPD